MYENNNIYYSINELKEENEILKKNLNFELIYYSTFTIKQLLLICDYYGITSYIRNTKSNKEDIINSLVLYESNSENTEIVITRKRLWMSINELKQDKFMKKYIIGGW